MVWVVATTISIASISVLSARLPEHVATHFSLGGAVNRWTDRTTYEASLLATVLIAAGFPPALCYCIRFVSPTTLNVPRREYWRSPEHFPAACAYIYGHSLWLGAVLAAWAAGLNLLVVAANTFFPRRLSGFGIIGLTGALLLASAVWIAQVVRFFKRASTAAPCRAHP
ncbi:MAG: hypothetical protein ACREFX_15565 [Opitutaceae bacterium]